MYKHVLTPDERRQERGMRLFTAMAGGEHKASDVELCRQYSAAIMRAREYGTAHLRDNVEIVAAAAEVQATCTIGKKRAALANMIRLIDLYIPA